MIHLLTKLLLEQNSENQNLLGLYRLLQLCTADIEQVANLFEATANDDDYLKFQAYQNYSEKLRTSILATASIALSSLSDPKVQELTNNNSLGDLYELRTHKTALFIIIPEKDVKHTSFLLNLFVKDVLDTLMIKPQKHQQSVFVFLDEFANLYLPDVTSVFTTIRKYRVALIIAIQSISQLYSLYKEEAQTILDNTLIKIILSGVSGDSAKTISELLGKTTAILEQEDRQVQYIPRMLMTPSEIRTIKEDQGILIYKNKLPIQLKMKPWYKQFLLKIRANKPIKSLKKMNTNYPYQCWLYYLIIFLILCWVIKPLRAIPKTLFNILGDLIKISVDLFLIIIKNLVLFLKSAIPTILEHVFKLIVAILLFLVRGIVWVLQLFIKGLYQLFKGIEN